MTPGQLDRIESEPGITLPELYRRVRTDSDWERSLDVLRMAVEWRAEYPLRVKSGMMLGLGESREQLLTAMAGVLETGCEILTLGQYLPPSRSHLPVERFVTPEEFVELKDVGESMGFRHVEAGPFVRSSYMAHRHLEID